MTTQNKNVTIKISGEETRVLKTIEKIESVFPLSVRSKTYPNDDGSGDVHMWLTVCLLEEPIQ
jgi:hypothetical protein